MLQSAAVPLLCVLCGLCNIPAIGPLVKAGGNECLMRMKSCSLCTSSSVAYLRCAALALLLLFIGCSASVGQVVLREAADSI